LSLGKSENPRTIKSGIKQFQLISHYAAEKSLLNSRIHFKTSLGILCIELEKEFRCSNFQKFIAFDRYSIA